MRLQQYLLDLEETHFIWLTAYWLQVKFRMYFCTERGLFCSPSHTCSGRDLLTGVAVISVQSEVKFSFFQYCLSWRTLQLPLVISVKLWFIIHPWCLIRCVLPPQVGGCANGVHEEQGVGQVFPRAAGISEALPAPGLLPAQASAEDPQVPPAAARTFVCHLSYSHTHIHLHTNNYFFTRRNPSTGTHL